MKKYTIKESEDAKQLFDLVIKRDLMREELINLIEKVSKLNRKADVVKDDIWDEVKKEISMLQDKAYSYSSKNILNGELIIEETDKIETDIPDKIKSLLDNLG